MGVVMRMSEFFLDPPLPGTVLFMKVMIIPFATNVLQARQMDDIYVGKS